MIINLKEKCMKKILFIIMISIITNAFAKLPSGKYYNQSHDFDKHVIDINDSFCSICSCGNHFRAILAECDIKEIDENLVLLTSKLTEDSFRKLITFSAIHSDSIPQGFLKYYFVFPNSTKKWAKDNDKQFEIEFFDGNRSNYIVGRDSSITIAKGFYDVGSFACVLTNNIPFYVHGYIGNHYYDFLYYDPKLSHEIYENEANLITITFPEETAFFFKQLVIDNEIVIVDSDTLIWRGERFIKQD